MPTAARSRQVPRPPGSRSRHSAPPAPPPAVDERLVMPETGFEIIDGEVFEVAPSDEPQGIVHAGLSAMLKAHAAAGYSVALDMLTRTSEKGDMAPSASVFPAERDPETGGRRIETLAFEVVNTEALAHAGRKARALAGRGVRRVFAIDVTRRRVLEWSRTKDTWQMPSERDAIADEALVCPMPIAALFDTTLADNAIARALVARKHPVIERARAEREAREEALGVLEGKAAALIAVLSARGFEVKKKARARIHAASEGDIDAWIARAVTCASVDDLLRG